MDVLDVQKWSYLKDIPDDTDQIRDLLNQYSAFSLEEINPHLYSIREQCWQISRHPFIGRWKFLRLTDPLDPCHQQVSFRLKLPKSSDIWLDLGCGLGQAIRQLRYQGVQGSRMIGIDVDSRFVKFGYDLFRDYNTLGARFVEGDILDPDDSGLDSLKGQVTIVHAESFFHLFTKKEQGYLIKRLVGFIKPDSKNAIVYGRQAGFPDDYTGKQSEDRPYVHTPSTFQNLWDEVGNATGTRWRVETDLIDTGEAAPWAPQELKIMTFVIHQISN